jgi:hypothetical protein
MESMMMTAIKVGNAINKAACTKLTKAFFSTILYKSKGTHPNIEVFLIPIAIDKQNATIERFLSSLF